MTLPTMKRTGQRDVTHSHYDTETMVLHVKFASGSIYRFEGVPKRFATEFSNAASMRRYVVQKLRTRFNFTRVGGT